MRGYAHVMRGYARVCVVDKSWFVVDNLFELSTLGWWLSTCVDNSPPLIHKFSTVDCGKLFSRSGKKMSELTPK